MTPPRSSDQSEGFRAKNRPSLTTYASIARPAAETFMRLTILAGRRNGCSAMSTDGRNRPLDVLWLPECDRSATTGPARGSNAYRVTAATRSGLEAVLEALRFHALFHGAAGEARAHLVVAAQLRFRGQRFVLRGALAARGGAMLRFSARIGRHASLLDGRRHALVVEAALVHGVGLADENMRGHFVFRAAKLTERRQKDQIIKRLGG